MDQEEIKKIMETLGKANINVAGDFVLEKKSTYTIEKVESGGIGMQFVNGKETPEQRQQDEEEPLRNYIFNVRLFDSNAKLVKLRNTIAAAIDMGNAALLYGEPQEQRINPSKKNEWYYIEKAIIESGVAKKGLPDADFVEQMVEWFPKLFQDEPQETFEEYKRNLAKSISHERSLWKPGMIKEEVPLKETWAKDMGRILGSAKAERVFGIAYRGLFKRLEAFKKDVDLREG